MFEHFSAAFKRPGFHMHDCRLTDVHLSEQALTFELKDGLYIEQKEGLMATGAAKIVFSKLYSPLCEIQYLFGERRERVDFSVFQKDVRAGTLDMIYEMYNEHCAHFEGILTRNSGWKTVEMKIFFKEMSIYYEKGLLLDEDGHILNEK